jgi:hypothetical protein
MRCWKKVLTFNGFWQDFLVGDRFADPWFSCVVEIYINIEIIVVAFLCPLCFLA